MVAPKLPAVWFPCFGALAAFVSLLLGAGFTVDDALISSRVAHHLSLGEGYRFNIDGAVTDAVTPLGWAYLLAPLSNGSAWAGLQAARLLGALSALGCGALLGIHLRRQQSNFALWALLPLALSLPFGAWGQSGMETPLVALLVCVSLFERRAAWIFASGAAAWRPELLPWALTWAALRPAAGPRERLGAVLKAASLPLLVALIRYAVFGQAAPLSVFAKPADSAQGFVYVLSGLVLIGLPLATVRFWNGPRLEPRGFALGAALMVELLALAVAGGDWMALFRLFVPLLPAWVWLFGLRLRHCSPLEGAGRVIAATSLASILLFTHGAASRGVIDHRRQAISELAPLISGAKNVGTVDVGWVGAATKASLVDFAGVTDPEVAFLPGSHTSKRLPADFVRRKRIDALVLLLRPDVTDAQIDALPWTALGFARIAEQRIARMEEAPEFSLNGVIEFGGNHRYVVLKRGMDPL